MRSVFALLLGSVAAVSFPPLASAAEPGADQSAAQQWVRYGDGPGPRVVLISGDEEYRSEEALPQLAKILATHHGFRTTVLFAIDPQSGEIDPQVKGNIPGLEQLDNAELMVLFTRFRDLPTEQMKHIADYVESGRPIIGIRTATHAFQPSKESPYARWGWKSTDWEGGFGRQVLGETWVSHHGKHGQQSTRGIIAPGMESHPILRGIHNGDIWGPTDVYGVRLPLPGDSQPLVLGEVLEGMSPKDKPVAGSQNEPMMPIAWTKTFTGSAGKAARVFTTTMGSAQDMENEGYRRLLVNACYWAAGMEADIAAKSNVELVGRYEAHSFRAGKHVKGVKPADLK